MGQLIESLRQAPLGLALVALLAENLIILVLA